MNKKIKLNPTIKYIVSILLIISIVFLGMQALKESKNVVTQQEEKIHYEYTYGTDINYAVNLVPNILYDTEKLYEDEIYISEFIKSINVNFKAHFKGSETTEIKGNYEIIAQLAGYVTQREEKQDIWTKDFTLVPSTAFEGQDTYELEKLTMVDYHTYNQLATAIIEASKVSLPVELRIMMKGELVADNAYKKVTQPIASTLVIPLGSTYFNITKLGVGETTDAVKEVIETPLPPNTKAIVGYVAGMVVLIVLLVAMWLCTVKPDSVDLRRKQIKKILTTHGSRMVAVDEIVEGEYKANYEVKSIEDLVKIADELEKPIIYAYNRNELKITTFYVMDKENRYIYHMAEETATEAVKFEAPAEPVQQQKEDNC